jgi:hypothetical protein
LWVIVNAILTGKGGMMKARLLVIALALSTFTGCLTALNARMYPVKGALAAQAPRPVLAARIALRQNGEISLTLADGETAKGRWTEARPIWSPNRAAGSVLSPYDEMAALWDSIYGPGYYEAQVLHSQVHAQATVNGNKGTVLNVEFLREEEQRYRSTCFVLLGVAKDSNGNIYKITL